MAGSMFQSRADTFGPLGKTLTRTDLVVEVIRTAILSGKLAPGTPLVENALAEELNVSKTPVREALIALVRGGLVEMTRNRGATVREMSLTDVLYVYQSRLLQEPWAVAQAAKRGVSKEYFDEAERLLDRADSYSEAHDRAARALANREFHHLMYAPCENYIVTEALDRFQDLATLGATAFLWQIWPTWVAESHEHRAILESVRTGKSELAEELVHAHISTSISKINHLHEQELAAQSEETTTKEMA